MNLTNAITAAHGKIVFGRRIRVLAGHIAQMLPANCGTLLDVGCGDGGVDALVAAARPGIDIRGIDVFVRPQTHIPVKVFDGRKIPLADGSVDVVMMIDVLHHTDDPNILLAEARRVARVGVLIKDHTRQSWAGGKTLALMDWVGNRGHGVGLPYNYWSMQQWETAWQKLGLTVKELRTRLGLYPAWGRPVFEWNLHLMAFLAV